MRVDLEKICAPPAHSIETAACMAGCLTEGSVIYFLLFVLSGKDAFFSILEHAPFAKNSSRARQNKHSPSQRCTSNLRLWHTVLRLASTMRNTTNDRLLQCRRMPKWAPPRPPPARTTTIAPQFYIYNFIRHIGSQGRKKKKINNTNQANHL